MGDVKQPAAGDGMAKTVLCAIYTRKSTDENLQSAFTSLDSQADYCKAFIKSREPEGWRVHPELYVDPGYSGGNMDRPALKKLVSDARQNKFQVVVCYKYDRLTRNTKDFLQLLEVFEKQGIHFVSVTQPIDTTSPVGRLMRSILMEFAQFEREMISERTRDKMSAMARKGKWTGGPLPLGYDFDRQNKKVLVNENEAKIARFMFETYLKEKSLNATAQIMNARGHTMKMWTTKNGRKTGGAKFFKVNLVHLLKNHLYVGKRLYHGELYKTEHPGIVDDETFQAVQNLLANNCVKKNSINTDKHDFLLKGLVRCDSCKSPMIPHFSYSKTKGKHFYYRCGLVNRSDKSACAVGSIRARSLEQFVIDQLRLLGKDEKLVKEVVQEAVSATGDELPPKRQERSTLSAELGKVEAELGNWMAILGEEGPSSSRRNMILERMDALSARREDLRNKLIALENEIVELETRNVDAAVFHRNLAAFMEVFEKLDAKQKKEFIRLLVQEVVYDKAQSRVRLGLLAFQAFEWSLDRFSLSFDTSIKWLPG